MSVVRVATAALTSDSDRISYALDTWMNFSCALSSGLMSGWNFLDSFYSQNEPGMLTLYARLMSASEASLATVVSWFTPPPTA